MTFKDSNLKNYGYVYPGYAGWAWRCLWCGRYSDEFRRRYNYEWSAEFALNRHLGTHRAEYNALAAKRGKSAKGGE